jgi:hypothetical protein
MVRWRSDLAFGDRTVNHDQLHGHFHHVVSVDDGRESGQRRNGFAGLRHVLCGSSQVNLTATPNSGYSFVNWTGNVARSTSASTTVTMNAPQSVTANFSTSAGESATNQFGELAISFMSRTEGVGTISVTTITSIQSELTSFDGFTPSKGDLGRVKFTTGSLLSGSVAGGGAFSETGSTFTIIGEGKWANTLTGLKCGNGCALFTGSFVGPIQWTLTSKVGTKLTYTLSGQVAGVLWDGRSVTGSTTQNCYTFDEQLSDGVGHISRGQCFTRPVTGNSGVLPTHAHYTH